MKKTKANVSFFKAPIRTADKNTINTVDTEPREAGRYITPKVKKRIKKGGMFSKYFANETFFSYKMNNKQPAAISQNLVGIEKYAAG